MTKNRKPPQKANVLEQLSKPHLYSIRKTYFIHANRYLSEKQVKKIFGACEKAFQTGTPLNRFFTIHYNDHADPKRPQEFVNYILERSRKWLTYRGIPTAYAYVIENGKTKGIHLHLLIHIPPNFQREYKRALARWLPFEWSRKRVDTKTISYPHYGELSPLDGVYGVLRYMCKGVNPATPVYGIKPKYQGEVFGQRWGVSKSLRE